MELTRILLVSPSFKEFLRIALLDYNQVSEHYGTHLNFIRYQFNVINKSYIKKIKIEIKNQYTAL